MIFNSKVFTLAVLPVFFAIAGFAQSPKQQVYVITQTGARGDGKTLNTTAIQKAIDKAAAGGGGRVIVPAGRFVTGPVYLKSKVELHLAAGAVLLGSTSRMDYGREQALPLISARKQQQVSITGKGEIDGRGRELLRDLFTLLRENKLQDEQWLIKRPTEKNRPNLVVFTDCDRVAVKGITLRNALSWVQDYNRCTQVIIDSVTVRSTEYWNNDGIDIVNCNGVSITHCDIDAADDAVCLKSEDGPGICENVYVGNCRLRSSANAFKLGTGSHGGFRNIKADSLTVYDTYRSAIALEAVDGGFLENIDIQHVQATRTGNAVFIKLGHRNTDAHYSVINNVNIAHVRVEVPEGKPDAGYPVEGPLPKTGPANLMPASVTGLPGHPVTNITLSDVEIVYGGGGSKEKACIPLDSLQQVAENPAGYPEFSMFGELPAWGFYLRHAEGVTLKGVKLRYLKDDFRPAVVADDVTRLALQEVQVLSGKEQPVLVFKNSERAVLQNVQLPFPGDKAIQYIP